MKHFAYISILLLILVFSSGCEKYEVIGPNAGEEDMTLRHEDLINDHIYEMDQANNNNDLRDGGDRPGDDLDGITDDDDEDDDSEESQDKTISN